MTKPLSPPDYPAFLGAVKERILLARTSAARAVNRNLILLYWDIGQGIVEKQQALGWGESVIDRLSSDLKDALPNITGFSLRNLRNMKRFYVAYTNETIWRQVVAKLPKQTQKHNTEFLRQAVAELRGHSQPENDNPIEIMRGFVADIPWGLFITQRCHAACMAQGAA